MAIASQTYETIFVAFTGKEGKQKDVGIVLLIEPQPQYPATNTRKALTLLVFFYAIIARSIWIASVMATLKNTLGFILMTLALPLAAEPLADFVKAARAQVGSTVRYDPTYYTLAYPNGDIPVEGGVCTDVVVRALRASHNMDLQKLVHEDMQHAFSQYPKNWGLKRTDKNIDHRRVLNLQTYFKRKGYELPISSKAEDYQAGDVVTVLLPANLPHIMIVSDKTAPTSNTPLIIHNIGDGTQEEDRLFEFKITGHYRIK